MRPHLADGEPKMRRMATPDERPFSRQTGPFAGLEARSVLAGNLSGLKKKSGLVRNQRLRLWRARRSSFRFLCLRIFLRRFLITLPRIHLARKIESRRFNTAMHRQSQPARENGSAVSSPRRSRPRDPEAHEGCAAPTRPVSEPSEPAIDPIPTAQETQHRSAAHAEPAQLLYQRFAGGIEHQTAVQVANGFGLESECQVDAGQVVVEERIEELLPCCRATQFERPIEATLRQPQTEAVIGTKARVGGIDPLCRPKLLECSGRAIRFEMPTSHPEILFRRGGFFHTRSPDTRRGQARNDTTRNRKERAVDHNVQPSRQHSGFRTQRTQRPQERSRHPRYQTVLRKFGMVLGSVSTAPSSRQSDQSSMISRM